MPHQIAERKSSQWVYTSIAVHDSDRILHPTHTASDYILFRTPPKLTTTRIEVVITNGENEFRSIVDVLPHDEDATEIPIRSVAQSAVE